MYFPKEEDSLSQAIKNPKSLTRPSSTKAIKLSHEDEMDLLRAKQAVKQLEEEEFFTNTKRSMDPDPPKQHFSATDNNFLSRKRATEKKEDEFDDILSALDAIENTNDKKAKTLNSFQPKNISSGDYFDKKKENKKEEGHNFFGELEDDNDLDIVSNKPVFNKTSTERMNDKTSQSFHTTTNDEIKKKRANLFGLNKEMSARNSEVNSNNQSFSKPNNENVGIGTIDLGVSRRKNQKNLSSHINKSDGRPMTSPMEKSPRQERNEKTTDFFEQNLILPGAQKHHVSQLNLADDNEEHIGDYVPSIASNRASQKPPLIRKNLVTNPQPGLQLSPSLSQKNLDNQFDKISIDNFDGRSKNNDITGNEDFGMLGNLNSGNILRKRTEDNIKGSSSARPISNINAMFGNLQNQNNLLPKDNVLDILSNRKNTEVEELRQHIESLKKSYEDQINTLKTNQNEELEFERKSRTKYTEDLEKQREREIERLKENYESEMKRKDELHKLEVDQLRRKYEVEIDSLKREIEQQVKISSLANEIQKHNDKLYDISEKLDFQKTQEDYHKTGEVYKREQICLEKERNLQKLIESCENDKRRLDLARQELENERALLRKEYRRLDELQANIKGLETEKQKDILIERKKMEKERESLEREKREFKEIMDLRSREHERLLEVFEVEKADLFQMNEKLQDSYRNKVKEIDDMRVKFTQQESDLVKRRGLLEKKELELAKMIDVFNTKNERLRLEQREFEKEARKIYEIASETKKESDFLNSFKRNFDFEKEKLRRKQMELDSYASALNHEKSSINRDKYDMELRAKTIDNLRYEVVKGLEGNHEFIKNVNNVVSPLNNSTKKWEYLNKTSSKENKKDVWNVIRKEATTHPEKFSRDNKKKAEDYNAFNSDKYMEYLKTFNKEHGENQAFLNMEREAIMGKKNEG